MEPLDDLSAEDSEDLRVKLDQINVPYRPEHKEEPHSIEKHGQCDTFLKWSQIPIYSNTPYT